MVLLQGPTGWVVSYTRGNPEGFRVCDLVLGVWLVPEMDGRRPYSRLMPMIVRRS